MAEEPGPEPEPGSPLCMSVSQDRLSHCKRYVGDLPLLYEQIIYK